MKSDREIGNVVLVNTYSALVELNLDSKSYVKSSFAGTYPIGVLNSYVIMPIGTDRIVAMVTKVQMKEESLTEFSSQKMLLLPTASRTMWVTMVGTISQKSGKKEFNFGINRYPELDNPVWLVTEEELDYIFEKEITVGDKKNRMISIGTSPIFSNYELQIDMDRFFNKHAAILGNTGSGKSCTVKAIIDAVLNKEDSSGMPNAHFIIFDTNNEYESCFTKYDKDGKLIKTFYDRLVIRNQGDKPTGFFIPYWFMDSQDFQAFFRPGEGAQAPLFQKAVNIARAGGRPKELTIFTLDTIASTINQIKDILDSPPTGNRRFYGRQDLRNQVDSIINIINDKKDTLAKASLESSSLFYLEKFAKLRLYVEKDAIIDAELVENYREVINEIEENIAKDKQKLIFKEEGLYGIDTPAYFNFENFVENILPNEIEKYAEKDSKIRNYISTLNLRIDRTIQDNRYNFIFKTPKFKYSLASFLRYVFGEEPNRNFKGAEPPWKNYYNNQIQNTDNKKHKITIVDFSNIASDVLENMTALIGRLILEFMQRIKPRGSYPTVLILEEAHHYIPAGTNLNERQQRAREVFERIAKEGRKYGLSLVVASQRPSELSRTVLAQCNSFIVHRIQNPDDKEYFKSVMPCVSRDLLDQLPSLAQQHALVLGDCITVPAQVRINDVDPKPDSHDPKFYEKWSSKESNEPNFEVICKNWEDGK